MKIEEIEAGKFYYSDISEEEVDLINQLLDDQMNFLDELDGMDTSYEVEKFDGEEDEGCEGGACKI